MKITELLIDMINTFKGVTVQPTKITLGHYEFMQLKAENKDLLTHACEQKIDSSMFCGVSLVESGIEHEISIK